MKKVCTKCGAEKPLEDFHKKTVNSDGRDTRCKMCIRDRDIKYRRENKEKLAERKSRYYRNNKEKIAQYHTKYRQANKEKIARYHAKYHRKNKEKKLKNAAQWRKNNGVRVLEWKEEYYANNKNDFFARNAERRAKKVNQTPTGADLKIIQLYYVVCSETNEILGDTFFHVDHIQPLSQGGLHHEDNLQILEATLNFQKRGKWPLTRVEQLMYEGVTL